MPQRYVIKHGKSTVAGLRGIIKGIFSEIHTAFLFPLADKKNLFDKYTVCLKQNNPIKGNYDQ
jgi:hypothetical protein